MIESQDSSAIVMHGFSPGFALLGNVEVSSMGGFLDCGVGLDTKPSPRRAAIEKTQIELRKEYDVREERKRELEFLEKGGNPLDFKFGGAASAILQATSFTDQQAEQHVTSEAKGGLAPAASPHGDSVGSSGRLGGSVGREPNIADNLLLLDGENSNPGGEKNVRRSVKRGNVSLLEQSLAPDGCMNAKETEESLIFHLGVKRQAYTRRNRSRTGRDNHNNKSTLPSSIHDHRDGNRSTRDERADNHGISSVTNSKPAVPNGNVISKWSTSDNQLLDGVQAHDASVEMVKDEVQQEEAEANISETMQETNHSNQQTSAAGELVANFIPSRSSGLIGKDEATSVNSHLVSLEPAVNIKDTSSAERVGSSFLDKDMTDVVDDDLTRKNCVVSSVAEVLSLNNANTDNCHAGKENSTAGDANNDNHGMIRNGEDRPTLDCTDSSVFQSTTDNSAVKEKSLVIRVEAPTNVSDQSQPAPLNPSNSIIHIKDEIDLCDNKADMSNALTPLDMGNLKAKGEVVPKQDRKTDNSLLDSSHSINQAGVITSGLVVPNCDPSTTAFPKRSTINTSAIQNSAGNNLKLAKKSREDAILKEARIIEVNVKRVGQLSTSYKHSEKRQKCHWDFVLEEMEWMANDFMQERLWKTAAAAGICHRIASTGRSKFEHRIICQKQRNITRTLAKAVMHFWHSIDAFQTTGLTLKDQNGECNPDLFKSCKANGTTAEKDQDGKMEGEKIGLRPGIQAYAVRFLKYDCNISYQPVLANAPTTPDRINDVGMLEKYWEDELSEENLFYRIPPGAMQVYREATEFHLMNYKKMGNTMHREDWEAIPCDSVPDGSRETEYEEEEGETGSYILTGRSEVTMSPKLTHKKRKNFNQKLHASRVYNVSSDFSYEPFLEGKSANQAMMFIGKRPSSNLNAGLIPTKRVRTASRQRVVSPFSAAATGNLQLTNKTDASSGDTSSFQDDQSSMHGGSQSWRNMEVESTSDYEVQFPFDGSEISTKSQKKKSKHLGNSSFSDSGAVVVSGKGSMLDQRLQGDSLVQQEQRDQVKKRLESQQFESNGKIGIYGQHAAKKPKLLKQLAEPSPEAIKPTTGSTPSPVTSQMSYMSNQNKLIKIITNRDRGRKSKALKVSARQSGSGISWTTFEDQALVVLVHDMGPNWELVGDAINSTLQFKCIFRKPKECKERHKILMDRSAGDGADSVEDSGSSQPYPSTLPGIPKGSAIQLFQRLQGPMEEDTVKAHFEKIILIGQQLPSCRMQKDTKQLKQLTPVHSSHDIALSQTYPNNLTGGVLSPLDLCDDISSSPDVLTRGYQGSHTSGVAPPNHPNHPNQQGSLSPVPSNSSVNSMLQGSSGILLGSNSPSPPTPLNAPARDQRYCMPRATSLPVDDQQTMHYTQMLSSRNIQQSSLSVPGAFLPIGVDRGAYMLPSASGNGMGMMGGRTMPMSKPGFQGINSPGMPVVSTGSMLASGGIGLPNPANINSVAVSSPGNSLLRPRDPLPVMRPGQIAEDHRQMMMQDLQPQVSQGNAQVVPPFNAMGVPFSTGTGLPSVQSYPAQQHQPGHQKPHQTHMHGNSHHSHIQGTDNLSPQQQAYAIRLARERQFRQRMVPHSQQPYSASHAMQVQNNSQLQQQTQPSSCTPLTPSHAQHNKQHMPHNPQSSSGTPNQFMKQRQRQQAQQQPRHQQQQKQPPQQQTKAVKGLGRGTTLMHLNPNVPSQASGTLPAPRNQASEKQGQGFFHGSSGLHPTLPQSSNHHKLYSHPPPQSSKQIPLLPSHSDACNQTPMPVSANQPLSSSQQPALPSSMPLATPSQQQQRHMNQQTQRMMFQQNRQLNADGRIQSSGDQVQKVNQMIPATSLPRGTDSVNPAPLVSSSMQWKTEPLHDSTKTAPISHVTGSSQENLVGSETLVPSSSEGAEQRQISGSVAMDGHVVGPQWQPQQPQSQPQLQEQQEQPHINKCCRVVYIPNHQTEDQTDNGC